MLERIHRRTLAVLRKEVQPVSIPALADFELRWQGLHPAHRLRGSAALQQALDRLRGSLLPAEVWERDALAFRIADSPPPPSTRPLPPDRSFGWARAGQRAI